MSPSLVQTFHLVVGKIKRNFCKYVRKYIRAKFGVLEALVGLIVLASSVRSNKFREKECNNFCGKRNCSCWLVSQMSITATRVCEIVSCNVRQKFDIFIYSNIYVH